jgi:hypothetical protein
MCSRFFGANLHKWIVLNIYLNVIDSLDVEWNAFWDMACDYIWTWRNKEALATLGLVSVG